ncbi:hypothetical protein [Ferruginibacter sp. SUN106]|uniref:hypothetical protein n=1 Tax=Ferruginibacter sp. SUN106 TaxID=2978348 RepID=UPI003D35CD88
MNLLNKITNLFSKTTANAHVASEDFSHLYCADENFSEEFYSNLIRTIIYTENIISKIEDISKVNYTTILRSVNPVYEGKPFYTFTNTPYGYIANSIYHPFNYEIILQQGLTVRTETVLPKGDLKKLGRILVFDNDITTYDGAAAAESGFVDNGDIPPLDTWFYVTRTNLYCWIPTMFIDKMADAIAVEIFDSYHWLDKSEPFLYLEIFKKLNHIS